MALYDYAFLYFIDAQIWAYSVTTTILEVMASYYNPVLALIGFPLALLIPRVVSYCRTGRFVPC